jgi:hypothetical protein
MKIATIALLFFCLYHLKANAQDENGLASLEDLDSTVNYIRPFKGQLEVEKKAILLGDINGDMVRDSAFIQYKRVLSPDNTYQKACGQNVCYCRIQFKGTIPEMIIEGYSIEVRSVADVTGDGKEDLLIFRELEQFNWSVLSLYSLYHNHWKLLRNVNVFLDDDAAYENRIVKSGSHYYIMEDVWKDHYAYISRKKVLIKKK